MPGSASFQYVRTYKSRNAINRQGVMTTIDLQDASQSAMPLILILSVGRDLALLDTRDAMLRACGYIVESELSEKQAINHFRAGDFDLVLLCHSIASQDRDHPGLVDSGIRFTCPDSPHLAEPRTRCRFCKRQYWM
jgi:hypothetical protein